MIRIETVVTLFPDVPSTTLIDWVSRGWVRPEGTSDAEWDFADIDIARIRLIRDLRLNMGIDEEAMPVVLSLLDQMHDTRRALRAIVRALQSQPESVRMAVLQALQE